MAIAPVSLHLAAAKALVNEGIIVSAQNCSMYGDGAYTGEMSAAQIKEFGLNWTLIGHSERRHVFGETDEVIYIYIYICLAY